MVKGDTTRTAILDQAIVMASLRGLNGITIGDLASAMAMSKSGLYVHFGSKEALQLAVIERVFEAFTCDVITPALALPPGRDQVMALFSNWVAWSCAETHPGGCPMLAAVMDADAAPGPVRDRLARGWGRWRRIVLDAASRAATIDMRPDLTPEAVTRQAFALYLDQHIQHWLMDDERAPHDACEALSGLLGNRRG